MLKKKSAPKAKKIPSESVPIRVNPYPAVFRERMLRAIQENKPQELYALVLEEARKRDDREDIYWILRHMAQVAEPRLVEWGDKNTSSAAISRVGSLYSIGFNPRFLDKYIHHPDDLLFLVLHEVLHKVRGDLRRPSFNSHRNIGHIESGFIANLAADLLINVSLIRQFFPEPPPMLEKLYRDKGFWLSFLLPPIFLIGEWDANKKLVKVRDSLRAQFVRLELPPDMNPEPLIEEAVRIYDYVWSCITSFDILAGNLFDLLDLFTQHSYDIAEMEKILEDLLGNHSGDEIPDDDPWWDWFREQFGKFFKAGYGKTQSEEESEPDEIYAWEFYEALRKALSADPKNPSLNTALLPEVGVVPFWGRKEIFLYRGGYRPVFCPNPVTRRDWVEFKVQLYIDVSGSTYELWPFLYGLALHLRDEIGEPFYIFSNQVEAIGLKELQEGKIRTTYGTDFDCVFNHAHEHRFSRILVITDGYANLKEENRKRNHLEVFAVLTEDNSDSVLVDVAGRDRKGEKWWVIDWEKIKQSLCM